MAGQNMSSAVMAQRVEPHHSLDDFPTPPWATRALMEHLGGLLEVDYGTRVAWDPACNRGYMARPLGEFFGRVIASDIFDYGWTGQDFTGDFLFPHRDEPSRVDWIITNPPFRLAERFARRALALASCGVAMIVRTAFLEGGRRYSSLFRDNPPRFIAQHVERVPMVKGRYDPKARSATAYCWLIWDKDFFGSPTFTWIPPSRARLERANDAGWTRAEPAP